MTSSSECNLISTSGSDTDVSLVTDDEMKCSLLRFEYSLICWMFGYIFFIDRNVDGKQSE